MTDEQPPITPPPPPEHGPFSFPPPPDPTSSWGPPPESPQMGWNPPRGFYPLDFDGITRTAGSIYRFAWRQLLGAALIPHVFLFAITIPLSLAVSPQLNSWVVAYEAGLTDGVLVPLPQGLLPSLVLLATVSFLGTLLVGVVAQAAIVHIGESVFGGRPVTIRGALGFGLRKAPALIGAQLLVFLVAIGVMLVGFVFGAFVIAGGGGAVFLGLIVIVGAVAALLFVAVRWALFIQAIALESIGPAEGLSRSWRLVSGSGWRVFGYILLLGFIGGLIGVAISVANRTVFGAADTSTLAIVGGTLTVGLGTILFAPISALVTLFLYYDLRFRNGEPVPQPGENRRAA